MTQAATPFARNWYYFKTGVRGIIPLAIFGVLLVWLFLRTNLLPVSTFFEDTTLTFNAVLYISIAVWIVVLAIANGRRLQKKRAEAEREPAQVAET